MSADVVYVDTSAVAKLLVVEAETAALRRWLASRPRRASSAVIQTELMRLARRAGQPRLAGVARRLWTRLDLIAVDAEVLERAGTLDPTEMRTLDAIHLATALGIKRELGAVLTYDHRMLAAAALLGIPTVSPA